MRKILFFIVCIASAMTLLGQTPSSADSQFKKGDYAKAQKSYKALIKSYPNQPLYLYRYARCAQELGDDVTAIKYFKKSGERYKLKYFYMGDSYLRLWKIDDALTAYNTYREKQPNERKKQIQERIDYAEMMQRYMRRVEQLQLIDSVNVPLDSMLHVIKLSAEAGQLALDAQNSIVYTNQRGDRKIWATTHKSNRILVSSQRLLDRWSRTDTLPQNINFTKKQCSPYLLNDGVTIYFAAEDKNGIGGLDIYVSRYNTATESYTIPENIGMPYNSPANEYMLILDEARKVGYLATDRFAKKGRVHIYSFVIPEQKQYWRNISDELLIAYARLQKFKHFTEDIAEVTQKKEHIGQTSEFCFVINDSIVYHSVDDFQKPTAKEKFEEWRQVEEKQQSKQLELDELRQQYATAEEDTKKELTPIILQLEKNLSQLYNRYQSLLQEIRKLELDATQE